MKPRLKYAEAFPSLDFEHMAQGTPLELDGERVTFEGWHHGHVWIKAKRRIHFLRKGDAEIGRLTSSR